MHDYRASWLGGCKCLGGGSGYAVWGGMVLVAGEAGLG